MVEAEGIEPSSGNLPSELLHAYPGLTISPVVNRPGRAITGNPDMIFALTGIRGPGKAILLVHAPQTPQERGWGTLA